MTAGMGHIPIPQLLDKQKKLNECFAISFW